MKHLSDEYLSEVNGGSGFWHDVFKAAVKSTIGKAYKEAWDARARYEYGVSYETLYKMTNR